MVRRYEHITRSENQTGPTEAIYKVPGTFFQCLNCGSQRTDREWNIATQRSFPLSCYKEEVRLPNAYIKNNTTLQSIHETRHKRWKEGSLPFPWFVDSDENGRALDGVLLFVCPACICTIRADELILISDKGAD